MTQLKDMVAPTQQAARVLDAETLRAATSRYLANPVFRAARYEELVLDDNPYRRPVRPDDIGLVDFATSLDRDSFAQLSGLMGHRMLLNIYDARSLVLPAQPTAEKWQDFQQFYDESNRVLGELIRPYLEEHLFAFVREEAAGRVTRSTGAIAARLAEFAAHRRDQAAVIASHVSASPSRESMTGMVALQAVAAALNARRSAKVPVLASLAAPPDLDGLGRALASAAGVKYEPHSYYQYYLPSTLARMNYVNAMSEPGRLFRLVGALLVEHLDVDVQATIFHELLDGGGLELPARRDGDGGVAVVLAEIERVGGDFALAEVSAGAEEYGVLLDVQHDDVLRQLTWIDAMPAYQGKARRLQQAIEEHQIPVHLDTFVESWEECSTTHVHDEDRLLIIESGQMDFWNCLGARHTYVPGDMAFIPKHRLHGSVVLTGECVYHQPVISAELDARFG